MRLRARMCARGVRTICTRALWTTPRRRSFGERSSFSGFLEHMLIPRRGLSCSRRPGVPTKIEARASSPGAPTGLEVGRREVAEARVRAPAVVEDLEVPTPGPCRAVTTVRSSARERAPAARLGSSLRRLRERRSSWDPSPARAGSRGSPRRDVPRSTGAGPSPPRFFVPPGSRATGPGHAGLTRRRERAAVVLSAARIRESVERVENRIRSR
jgi:hypothetical protein